MHITVMRHLESAVSNATHKFIMDIPPQPQSQAALNDQLRTLAFAANRLGLYDAADFLNRVLDKEPSQLLPSDGGPSPTR